MIIYLTYHPDLLLEPDRSTPSRSNPNPNPNPNLISTLALQHVDANEAQMTHLGSSISELERALRDTTEERDAAQHQNTELGHEVDALRDEVAHLASDLGNVQRECQRVHADALDAGQARDEAQVRRWL